MSELFPFYTTGKEGSDSDFEEVPEKEGFEPRIPDHLREEYGLVNKVKRLCAYNITPCIKQNYYVKANV